MTNKLQEFIEDLCPQPVDISTILLALANRFGEDLSGLIYNHRYSRFKIEFYGNYWDSDVEWDIHKKFFEQKLEIQLAIAKLLGFEND